MVLDFIPQIPPREPGTAANEWVCVFVSPLMEINS